MSTSRHGRIVIVVAAALALLWAAGWLWWRLSPPMDSRTVFAIAIAALGLLAGVWWLWWRFPQRQVARLALKIRDPRARADVEDNLRKTVGQAVGGAVVLIGAGAAYLQFSQQQQAAHDLLISNQVSKGFEQLAGGNVAVDDKVIMRLGGIYALEGVMNTSEQYHQPVLEALCAFVRDGTRGKKFGDKPTTEIQAALTVIGRHKGEAGVMDLTGAQIPGADLARAHLLGVYLNAANLRGATMFLTDLTGAFLVNADLTGATLISANLTNASLFNANLSGANLSNAKLSGAYLFGANLTRAVLFKADLRYTTLLETDLTGAILTGANLTDPTLGLTQAQLDKACGTDAYLPPGLTLKPCPDQ